MKTQRICPLLALVFVAASAAGCHRAQSTNSQSPEQARQSAVAAQAFQINHSNLPPDQKQRLLSQIGASGTK